jgi:ubiquinone/menaquinone biosynthesis C-methylase UbiE
MSDAALEMPDEGFDLVAAGWKKWTHISSRRDAGRYFEAAKVAPGAHVLEIGAGTGDQTIPLAQEVGPRGRVAAVDPSQKMLAFARERAEHASWDNIAFHVGVVSALEFAPRTFDAAISGFTWLFLEDPVGEASRVLDWLKPGGRFAASTWGRVADVHMMAIPMRVVLDGLGMDTAAFIENAPSPLSDPEDFADVFDRAGFVDVRVEDYRVDLTYDSPAQYAEWVFDIILPVVSLIEEHAPRRRDEFQERIAAAVSTHTAPDGSVRLSNPAFMASGARASS